MQQPHDSRGSGAGPSLYLSSYNQLMENDGSVGLRRFDATSIGLITAMQERENALREKNAAVSEKKAALKDRDNALLQRDVAYAERDSAILDRDRAVAALTIAKAQWEACPHCSRWSRQSAVQKFAQPISLTENAKFAEAIASIPSVEMPQETAATFEADGSKKRKKSRKSKESQKQDNKEGPVKRKKAPAANNSTKPPTPSKKVKVSQQESSKLYDQSKLQNFPPHKDNSGDQSVMNGSAYNHSAIPSPYCSCTGMNQQCYRWGSGGWQSACCTNQISMYPLPMNPKKKGCRVAGRKMSAGAFGRLLERLVSEGWDISTPVDLKEYWSKHGTNRYVTIK